MKSRPRITESEWPLMCVLWEKGSATAGEIADAVTDERDIASRTVKSLLRRLVEKKAVAYAIDPDNPRLFHYRPLIKRDVAMRDKNQDLVSLFYNNRVTDLLAKLVTDNPMTRDDIETLKRALDAKAREEGSAHSASDDS